MPTINKAFTLSISPEQFLNACSDVEKQELALLLNKPQNQVQEPKQVLIQQIIDGCLDIMDIAETQEFLDWPSNEKMNLHHTVQSALGIAKQIKVRNEK